MTTRPLILAALLLAGSASVVPAVAQLGRGDGYTFLQAIKEPDGKKVIEMLEKPGATVINTRDLSSGDGALHIVARRGDATYLGYLLSKDADPNLRNNKNETALLIATIAGRADMVSTLAKHGARVDLADSTGQTALIYAVQRRNIDLVRTLLDLGADPDQKDLLQGFSARDYAHQDSRTPAIAQLIDATPKKARRAVSGPKL